MKLNLLWLWFFLVAALEVSAQGSGTTPGYTESEIKAAFILHLMSFIRWPNNEQPNALCVVDKDGVFASLEELINKRASHNITLKVLVDTQEMSTCDLLFMGQDVSLPSSTPLQPLLTIGERTGFAASGGMVELKRHAGRVELIINDSELQHAGFSASSRLMSLATIVTPGVASP